MERALYYFYFLATERNNFSPLCWSTMMSCLTQAHSNRAKLTWIDTSETVSQISLPPSGCFRKVFCRRNGNLTCPPFRSHSTWRYAQLSMRGHWVVVDIPRHCDWILQELQILLPFVYCPVGGQGQITSGRSNKVENRFSAGWEAFRRCECPAISSLGEVKQHTATERRGDWTRC